MAVAIPDEDTVIAAVSAAITALIGGVVPSFAEVFDRKHRFEDQGEELFARQVAQAQASKALDAFYIDLERTPPLEGPGVGERYVQYLITVVHWNVRVNDVDWIKTARAIGKGVEDALENNATIFAISGQRQLKTMQTVEREGYDGLTTIESEIYDPQDIIQGIFRFSVEGRRWT